LSLFFLDLKFFLREAQYYIYVFIYLFFIMKKQLLAALLGVSMVFSGNVSFAAEDAMMMKHEMNIVDVTDGAEIRGITTSQDAAGYAHASYNEEDGYVLHAKFSGLTDPQGDDFYEGWVVRQNPFAFWSTGKLEKGDDGSYINDITSSIDYSEYDFYVLTLEPNDGDDAPADHILEGDVVSGKMMKHDDAMMMKKVLTPKQKSLRKAIKERIEKIDTLKIDLDVIAERIEAFKARIDEKNYSTVRKARVLEILDALHDVIIEMKSMSGESMMEK